MIPFPIFSPVSSSPALSVVKTSANSEETTTNPKTWTAAGIGTASADRFIVVATVNRVGGNVSFPTVTVGVTATTRLGGIDTDTGANSSRIDFYITNSAITSGTTADIVINHPSGVARHGYMAWAVTGSSAPTQNGAAVTSTSDPSTTTINCAAGDVVIGAGFAGVDATTSTPTGLTEDFDAQINAASTYTGMSKAFATAQTGLSIGCDFATYTHGGFLGIALSP